MFKFSKFFYYSKRSFTIMKKSKFYRHRILPFPVLVFACAIGILFAIIACLNSLKLPVIYIVIFFCISLVSFRRVYKIRNTTLYLYYELFFVRFNIKRMELDSSTLLYFDKVFHYAVTNGYAIRGDDYQEVTSKTFRISALSVDKIEHIIFISSRFEEVSKLSRFISDYFSIPVQKRIINITLPFRSSIAVSDWNTPKIKIKNVSIFFDEEK